VGSLRPTRTARKTLGCRTFGHPSCGGFMPTTETTLIPASGNQRAAKRSLTSDSRLDKRTQLDEVDANSDPCANKSDQKGKALSGRCFSVNKTAANPFTRRTCPVRARPPHRGILSAHLGGTVVSLWHRNSPTRTGAGSGCGYKMGTRRELDSTERENAQIAGKMN